MHDRREFIPQERRSRQDLTLNRDPGNIGMVLTTPRDDITLPNFEEALFYHQTVKII